MQKGLGELKQFLPYNYRKQITDATGYSKSYVYKVATGRLTNYKMQDELLRMADENKRLQEDFEQRRDKGTKTIKK